MSIPRYKVIQRKKHDTSFNYCIDCASAATLKENVCGRQLIFFGAQIQVDSEQMQSSALESFHIRACSLHRHDSLYKQKVISDEACLLVQVALPALRVGRPLFGD